MSRLNIKGLLSRLLNSVDDLDTRVDAVETLPHVVEFGTSGTWTYRKWSNGVSECWGSWSGTISHYGTSFGGYAYTKQVTLPSGVFISAPLVVYSGTVGSSFALTGTLIGRTSTYVNCYAISGASGSQSVSFYLFCQGKWK